MYQAPQNFLISLTENLVKSEILFRPKALKNKTVQLHILINDAFQKNFEKWKTRWNICV